MKFSEASVLSAYSVLKELNSNEQGLSTYESKKRLDIYGLNELETFSMNLCTILLNQFKSPFVILLLIASIISLIVGETANSFIIASFVVINVILGFWHEAKAQKAALLLKKKIPLNCWVLRNGKKIHIDKKFLVPGDIVLLNPWDIAPADLRLIHATNLTVDESMLSGESNSVFKKSEALRQKTESVFKAKNIIFAGSTIITGEATGVIIATGKETVLGEIAQFIKGLGTESNYSRKLHKLYSTILKIVIVSIFIIFFLHLLIKGHVQFFDFIIFIIALIVGIVPEALPTVATSALSLGALKLAQKQVIVKRLAAIEDLGDIEILCTDKTGTLTENKPELENVFSKNPAQCLLFGILCSPVLKKNSSESKNPIDIALEKKATQATMKKTEEFTYQASKPFDSFRMRSSVLVKDKKNTFILIVKGAPEEILKISQGISDDQLKEIVKQIEFEGMKGRRTIAVAFKEISKPAKLKISDLKISEEDETGLNFLGFFSFADPLKKQSRQAILDAKKLGLSVKILTGDHDSVAKVIGKEIGLITKTEEVITGLEIEKLSARDFQLACEKYSIFARISPKTKYKIVKALQKKHDVGFLGDGINDAPALKIANVGITVKGAADVAKEAADIILLRKDLMVLIDGIKEGRIIFANINKFITCTLASNFGNCYSMALISLILPFIPILPIQILLVNLLSDFPLISMATDSVDVEELKRPKGYYISNIMPIIIVLALISSIFDLLFFYFFFKTTSQEGLRTLWFIMSIFTEVALIFSIRTTHFFMSAKAPSKWLMISSIVAIVTTVWLPFTIFGQKYLGLSLNVTNQHKMLFMALICSYFFVSEFIKFYYFKLKNVKQIKTS